MSTIEFENRPKRAAISRFRQFRTLHIRDIRQFSKRNNDRNAEPNCEPIYLRIFHGNDCNFSNVQNAIRVIKGSFVRDISGTKCNRFDDERCEIDIGKTNVSHLSFGSYFTSISRKWHQIKSYSFLKTYYPTISNAIDPLE